MSTKVQQTLKSIYDRWRSEDRQLEACIDSVRLWMHEVNQIGIPHFGETASRLGPLRERLLIHFERESELIDQLAEVYTPGSPEVDAVRRQSVHDHELLIGRLDELIERLTRVVPPFASWQSAMDEVEMFVDVLEQHEDQESESFEMLIPVINTGMPQTTARPNVPR